MPGKADVIRGRIGGGYVGGWGHVGSRVRTGGVTVTFSIEFDEDEEDWGMTSCGRLTREAPVRTEPHPTVSIDDDEDEDEG
jgi:hypothetical protein